MIKFSNGHSFEYMVASGALGFKGRGWLHEIPLVWLGLIKPELFTVVIRSLTRQSRLYPKANLSWIRPWTWLPLSPWSCVRFLPNGGTVNKVGLYNPGAEWWQDEVGPRIDFKEVPLVGSIYGDRKELVEMAIMLDPFGFVAMEVNSSCPNAGHAMAQADTIIADVTAVAEVTRHPVIAKVSVDQDYLAIARGLEGIAQAISLNSVPWKTAFPPDENGKSRKSPLWRLEQKVGGGGGGVSGRPAQDKNWRAVEELAKQGALPVIGPSVMEFDDLSRVRSLGADAVSYGAIHLRTPWKPTAFVEREQREQKLKNKLKMKG